MPHGPLFLIRGAVDSTDGPAAGFYIYAQLNPDEPLRPMFDLIAARLLRAEVEDAAQYEGRLVWSVILFGIERDEVQRAMDAQTEYDALWGRHPELWTRLQRYETVFSFWLVDCQLRPFHAWMRRTPDGEFRCFMQEDVRYVLGFRAMQQSTALQDCMTVKGVHAESLENALEAFDRVRPRTPPIA